MLASPSVSSRGIRVDVNDGANGTLSSGRWR